MITKSNKFRAIRYGITAAVGLATHAVVSAALKNNTAEPQSKTQKVTIGLGSFAVASMVAEKAAAWADRHILGAAHSWEAAEQKAADQNATK